MRFSVPLVWLVLAVLPGLAAAPGSGGPPEEGHWLIRVAAGEDARQVAAGVGAQYERPLQGLEGWHRVRFVDPQQGRPAGPGWRAEAEGRLRGHPRVTAHHEDRIVERHPCAFLPSDPLFPDQWHLENIGQGGGLPFADIAVRPVWDAGWSGQGATVAIVDQGVEYRHPDLAANHLAGSGYDYRDGDADPAPRIADESHGTAVAGIVLAAANATGGLGVAHRARLVPVRLIGTRLSGYSLSSSQIAEALAHRRATVDIYNNSWGPPSEGNPKYSMIEPVERQALADGARYGRGGRGSIYVWAAGNGGLSGHNANYDEYNTSPYTISVGAVGDDDIRPGYSVPGANLLVAAPSGGRGRGILTTDNTAASGLAGYADGDYYPDFSGTSAAAPIVSGVVALLLQQRPDLGWRDVQMLLALTAVPVDFAGGSWTRNGAGHWVSHDYGFGRVDAAAAMRLAAGWPLLPELRTTTASSGTQGYPAALPEGVRISRTLSVVENLRVQHVLVTVNSNHRAWGDLRVELVSPAGTSSVLAESHASPSPASQPGTWTYLSTRHLNELSQGAWTLHVTDEGSAGTGSLLGWSVTVWGTAPQATPNRPPQAADLHFASTVFPLEIDLLAGAADPDGDPLQLLSVQAPRGGTLSEPVNGRVRFTMGLTATGRETFSALLGDGRGGVVRRLVHVRDPRPVARNDLFPIRSGTTVALPVLDNDHDPDGNSLRLVEAAPPRRGSVAINPDQTIRYSPPAGFAGVDRFRYRMTDDTDGEAEAWVTVVVQQSPDLALEFDGVDDYLRLPPEPALPLMDSFTAEAWIYPTGWGEYVTGFGRIFDRDSFIFFLNGFDHAFYNDRSLVAYLVQDDGTAVAANSAGGVVRLNEWQHVAVSFTSGSATPVRFYVDGQPVAVSYPLEGSSPPRRPLRDNRGQYLYMGEAPSGARAFQGRMTEFRIWDHVVAPATVLARRDLRLTGTEPGLQLYFPFAETLGPTAASTGMVKAVAELSGARRVPRLAPWRALESRYNLLLDAGSGWWRERSLGWLYGDAFPWVYLPELGWVYTGHGPGSGVYWLYPAAVNWGWLMTGPALHPWFYRPAGPGWLWSLGGFPEPGWFYASEVSDWIAGGTDLPGS